MAKREFKIVEVRELESKTGNKFTVYKVAASGGKKIDCKFTKAVKNGPEKPCTIIVDEDNANVDTSRMYPVLWIKAIDGIRETVHRSNLSQFFGDIGDESEYEDLT